MTQKILVKLHFHCDKCRTKAMKIAATTPGVNTVSIEGADRDHIEVIGNGIDSVCLTRALRKKLGFADIIKLEQVGESTSSTTEEEEPTLIQYCITTTSSNYSHHFQHPQIAHPIYYHQYNQEQTDNCSIM